MFDMWSCMLVCLLLVLVGGPQQALAANKTQCDTLNSCSECTEEWDCAWCPHKDEPTGVCLDAYFLLGPHGRCPPLGSDPSVQWGNWQWKQCKFAGWILMVAVFGVIVLILLVLLICICCCCCRMRKRRRNRRRTRAESLNNAGEMDPLVVSDTLVGSPQSKTPKTDAWRRKMESKYGI